jgi:hypothetical protein
VVERNTKAKGGGKTKKSKDMKDPVLLDIPDEEIKPEAVVKPKRKSRKKKKTTTEKVDKKVSLDSDEPLQMELDF